MKASLFILWMTIPLCAWSGIDDDIFHNGNFISAKEEARATGKIQLLEFVAEWCMPCKHMDQTTFKNADVQALLEERFVSVKVDIDQFDGFALKEEFQVRFLPTIVLLDHEGNLIGKIEEALGPSELINRLNALTGDIALAPKHQTKASDVKEESAKATYSESLPSEESKPERPVKPVIPESTPATYHMLQFGVFGSESNAQSLYKKITTFLPSEPEIKVIQSADKVLYKVIYGPFRSEEEAIDMQTDLKKNGFDSLVKDIE